MRGPRRSESVRLYRPARASGPRSDRLLGRQSGAEQALESRHSSASFARATFASGRSRGLQVGSLPTGPSRRATRRDGSARTLSHPGDRHPNVRGRARRALVRGDRARSTARLTLSRCATWSCSAIGAAHARDSAPALATPPPAAAGGRAGERHWARWAVAGRSKDRGGVVESAAGDVAVGASPSAG